MNTRTRARARTRQFKLALAHKLTLTTVLTLFASASVASVSAQTNAPKPFTVLVPPLENGTRTVSLFGDSVAQETIKRIVQLEGHRAITWEEADRALPAHLEGPYCVVARQAIAALQRSTPVTRVDALVCGSFQRTPGEEGLFVTLNLVPVADPEARVHSKSFKATSAVHAASVIMQELSAFRKRE